MRFASHIGIFVFLCAFSVRADWVAWSDGKKWEGKIELGSSDAVVSLHDGTQLHTWKLSEITSIDFSPDTQSMERAWTFVDAGKTTKKMEGNPYPTMELQAIVTRPNGDTLRGHLITTSLYLSDPRGVKKLLLPYKLRGQEGQRFDDLVYVRKIAFGSQSLTYSEESGGNRLLITLLGCPGKAKFGAVSCSKMEEAAVVRMDGNDFRVNINGGNVVVAVWLDGKIWVGWRGAAPTASRTRIEAGLSNLRDFFDDRRLLATSADPLDETTYYTLILFSRTGKTTSDTQASQPWHLEVCKWRLGAETSDVTLVSRCILLRDLRSPNDPLPAVVFSSKLKTVDALHDGMSVDVRETDSE